jgi:hypothetical protein
MTSAQMYCYRANQMWEGGSTTQYGSHFYHPPKLKAVYEDTQSSKHSPTPMP